MLERAGLSPRARNLVQVARFGAVGVLNTGFGYAAYAFMVWTGLPLEIALLFSTLLGFLFNYVTYGRLAFASRLNRANLTRYVLVCAIFYVINAILLRLLVSAAHLSPYLAQILLMPLMAIGLFFGLRFFVYRASP